jgi:hypothetical protein
MVLQVFFGEVQTGLGFRFYDASGGWVGARVTAGILALPEAGAYAAGVEVPSGAAGVFWDSAEGEASEDLREPLSLAAADQVLLTEIFVPVEGPSLIIPAPADDESLTVVFAYTETIYNEVRAGISFAFSLVSVPAKSDRILEVAEKVVLTDADGFISLPLRAGLSYLVRAPELGLQKTFVPSGETFNLLDLL